MVETCPTCNEGFNSTQSSVKSGSHRYHKDHFRCSMCQCNLVGQPFFQADDLTLYCNADYENNVLPKCFACTKPISSEFMEYDGEKYHPACFKCSKCNVELTEAARTLDEKQACTACFEATLPTCGACTKPVEQESISACEKTYHKACFKCTQCSVKLEERYYQLNELPYCVDCQKKRQGRKCEGCTNLIIDEYYAEVESRAYHHPCFRCVKCSAQLIPDTSRDTAHNVYRDGTTYLCEDCHMGGGSSEDMVVSIMGGQHD